MLGMDKCSTLNLIIHSSFRKEQNFKTKKERSSNIKNHPKRNKLFAPTSTIVS